MHEGKEPIVQIKQLNKKIGSNWIIKDLSLDLYPGEVFGFLGPNGAGKTTTIRMMVGLISITKGDVLIAKHSIHKDFEKAVAHVGAIVENPEMYKFLSGYQNLLHYARMIPGVHKARIQEVVDQVGLGARIKDKVKTYSLGMRQRLGLAQALLHRPAVLILDEPTNGLDPAGIREFRDYLRQISREEQVAVMVSSHLLSEMELMCDRVGIIQHGQLIGIQKVKELVQDAGNMKVIIDVDSMEKAQQLLNEDYNAEINQQQLLEVTSTKEQIPQIIKLLVQQDLNIFSVQSISKTLEDRFLEVTGGRGIE